MLQIPLGVLPQQNFPRPGEEINAISGWTLVPRQPAGRRHRDHGGGIFESGTEKPRLGVSCAHGHSLNAR